MTPNLQRLKGLYEAFAKGDVAAVLGAMDDRIEWCEPASLPYESQIGPQAVAQNIFARVIYDVSDFSVAPEEFVDGGDTIVAVGTYRGKGAKTGVQLDTPFVHVWRFRDGKLSYFRTHTDTKIWAEVLGV